jgi:hypothetical protein
MGARICAFDSVAGYPSFISCEPALAPITCSCASPPRWSPGRTVPSNPDREDYTMKHFLNGVAVVGALVIAAPVWAQNPSGGNPMGTPGPNPGGPGLTPYSGGASPAPVPAAEPPSRMNRMPAGGSATSDRGVGTGSRAHHPRHAVRTARNPSADNSADQLNQQELSTLPANPTTMNRMPAGGRTTSGTDR